ncbi:MULTISPECIES: hypothetical protein [Rhodococcus]|uniref:hypothetical protein n=1 Tax=Rhodococcus TaxID=1827 RepID=UPI00082BE7EF|nr:hypothetical protein [Rhodococcus phenolicus]
MRTAGDTEAADNTVETIRQFEITYDGVAQAGATTMITLETTLATADEYLGSTLEKLTDHTLVTTCAAPDTPEPRPRSVTASRR